jgi:hypothetical protein
MRFPGISTRLRTLAPVIGAVGAAVALFVLAPMAHAHINMDCGVASASPCPTPPPTPTPVNAFLSLDVTAGDANTQITVNGSAFLANESTSLYWDQPNKVAGASNADANGNFTTKVKPFSGDPPGLHHLCASVLPNPCASFTLQGVAVTPTPQPSPSDSPSPSPDTSSSPSASPSAETATPTRFAATPNGLDLMLKPPFVILPIIAGLGLAIALIYWILSVVMRPRERPLKSVAVAHLASRPDYSAAFGAPPPAPAPAAQPPSAWADGAAPTPAPTEAASVESPSEGQPPATSEAAGPFTEEPPVPPSGSAPPDIAAPPDEPPDLPEPGDY